MIKGARKTVKCKKTAKSPVNKCITCKAPIKTGDLYTAYMLKARTNHERMSATRHWGATGCWYFECNHCAETNNVAA